ncbi:sugar transporter [Thozetella sp. PMI_491]|nr:sugar transporter [Thozetella sp. PMI_491]
MGRLLVTSCAAFAALGGFLFGYDSGIISSTIAQPQFVEYFQAPSDAQTGGIVSAFQGKCGAILGCLSVSGIGDSIGRKQLILLASVLSVIGSSLQGGAIHVGMLIAGRLLAGIAVGQLSSTVPIYCAEIAPPSIRGMLSGLLQWMLSWGFFAAQWIGYGCTQSTTSFQWRFPLSFQVVPALILACGILFLPESPRWLMEKDRVKEARTNLRRLHYNGKNEEFLALEFSEISQSIAADRLQKSYTFKQILTNPSWRRRLALGCGIQAFGQLSGINVINYYGPRIYESLGIETKESLMITGINGTTGIIENTIILLLIDRLGRVWPLAAGGFGMFSCMLINAVLNKQFPADAANANSDALRAMVAMNFVFQLAFQPLGNISWIYPAEIFPTEIRALGASLSALANWCLNLLFAQCSPIALAQIGFNYFYFFAATNLLSVVCYIMFYPETKGRTLEQMDELFEKVQNRSDLDDQKFATLQPGQNEGITHVEKA